MIRRADNITLRDEEGGIPDVVDHILDADKTAHKDITGDVEKLRGETDEETARNIWRWIKGNPKIKYVPDYVLTDIQKVRKPARLFHDGVGDCKSLSLLAGAFLRKLNIPYEYVVIKQDSRNPHKGHIYVQTSSGVILDPVNDVFNEEPRYWKKMKYKTRIQTLSGLGQIPRNINLEQSGNVRQYSSPNNTTFVCGPSADFIIGAIIFAIIINR